MCIVLCLMSLSTRMIYYLMMYIRLAILLRFQLGSDYRLHPVKEFGPGGWMTASKHMADSPGNWSGSDINFLLDTSEAIFNESVEEQKLRARVIRKKRSVGLVPSRNEIISREAMDETVLRVHDALQDAETPIPFCAFNGGSDAWVDAGNKRVGVQVLQACLGIGSDEVS